MMAYGDKDNYYSVNLYFQIVFNINSIFLCILALVITHVHNFVIHPYCQKTIPFTSLNVDSLIGSMLPKIESTCLTTIIGLEIYLEHRQLQ